MNYAAQNFVSGWMHRVRAIEDHGTATLTIETQTPPRKILTGMKTESTSAELMGGPIVDEWRTKITEDKLAILTKNLTTQTTPAI